MKRSFVDLSLATLAAGALTLLSVSACSSPAEEDVASGQGAASARTGEEKCRSCKDDSSACTAKASSDDDRLDCSVGFHRCVEDNKLPPTCMQ